MQKYFKNCTFIINKNISKLGIKRNLFNQVTAIYQKPIANTFLNGKILEASSVKDAC